MRKFAVPMVLAFALIFANGLTSQEPPKPAPEPTEQKLQVFQLENLNAAEAVDMLRRLLEKDEKLGSANLVEDNRSNSIIIRAADSQIEQITKLLNVLDDQAGVRNRPLAPGKEGTHNPAPPPPTVPGPDATIPPARLPSPVPVPNPLLPSPAPYISFDPAAQANPAMIPSYGPQIATTTSVGPVYHARMLASANSKEMQAFLALEKKAFQLANEYRVAAAKEEDKESEKLNELRSRLEEVVKEAFAKRQEAQEVEVKHLKERLAKVEESFAKRATHKDQIIDNRVKELLNEERELQWDVNLGAVAIDQRLELVAQHNPNQRMSVYAASVAGQPIQVPVSGPAPGLVSVAVPREVTASAPPLGIPSNTFTIHQRTNDSVQSTVRLLSDAEGQLAEERIRAEAIKRQFENKTISKTEHDVAQERVKQLENRIATLRRELATLTQLLQIDIETAKARLDGVNAQMTVAEERFKNGLIPDGELAKLKAQSQEAQLQLKRAKTLLELYQSHQSDPATKDSAPAVEPRKR